MANLEFYIYEGELWCKDGDKTFLVDRTQTDLIDDIIRRVKECYPKAYAALDECYRDSAPNRTFCRYKMARRFVRCNFGQLDSTSFDIEGEKMNFERMDCPLRLECKYDGVICSPIFKTTLSSQEMKVGKLWFEGLSKDEIGGILFLSPETVNNHIRYIYHKLSIHGRPEFVRYSIEHGLFNT